MAKRYDTIIVGAGSAGCVLAGRLSEDPARSVLLVEAGPDSPLTHEAQSFLVADQEPGRIYTDLVAERTPGTVPRLYSVGRGVGGSSAINAMVAMWGLPEDYDRWERDLGCEGWSWADVKPVFSQLRKQLSSAPRNEWGVVGRALLDAAVVAGHQARGEYVLPDSVGAAPAMLTRLAGRRVSAADAYLTPARGRPNLSIEADRRVDRVIVDDRRAVGIATADGAIIEGSEVVISAGAIHSPMLLIDSGIDRPGVGRGLKDHPSATITLELRDRLAPASLAVSTVLRWSSSIGEADLQLVPLDHTGLAEYGALMAAVMTVHSEGSVERIDGATTVRFNMLADERDRTRMREAIRHAAEIAATTPIAAIASRTFIDNIGTPLSSLPDEDAVLDHWLQQHVGDYVHASCSCRMGRLSDDRSVVDSQGRVHGYSGLRVCDTSIFPDIPRANTHLPVLMVAERIAAMISAS